MSSISKKVTIDKKLTLLDLNENVTNFMLKFSLSSENMKDVFHMAITTQEDLDEGKDMEFKKVDGEISGEFSNYDNKYKNYILCLKSDTPTQVNVSTNIQHVPDVVPYNNTQTTSQNEENYSFNNTNTDSNFKASDKKWKIIISVVILFGGLGLIYYLTRNKKSENSKNNSIHVSNQVSSSIPELTTNIPEPTLDIVKNSSMPFEEIIKYSPSSSSSSSSSSGKGISCSPTTNSLMKFLKNKN